MRKVLFIMPSLQAGGAERVIAHLANGLINKQFKVTIALTRRNDIQYPLKPNVDVCFIGKRDLSPLRQIFFIRKMMKSDREQTVISFLSMQSLYTLIASFGLRNKVIVSVRNDPSKSLRSKPLIWLRNILYPHADKIVFQTEDARNYFKENIRKNGVLIANPLPDDIPSRNEGIREKRLVTVARLEKQKNIPMLLEVCRNIFEKYPDYHLELYGVGELEAQLKQYTKDIGIEAKVDFKGHQERIPEKIKTATAFLLTSDYEGISNAMLEALAVGLPCICTDCPVGGARMYIRPMENGILVPVGDVDGFTEAVMKVLGDEDLQNKLGREAAKIVTELSLDKILEQWIQII